MRLFTKIYLTVVVALLVTQLFSLCFLVAVPVAQAADDVRELKLAVPFNNFSDLGAIEEKACDPARQNDPTAPQCMYVPWLVNYIGNAYRYGVVIGSVIAVVMVMVGGLLYMTAGASPQMASRGREYIVGAVTGLALLLGSYMLLNIVNPNLVHLQPIKVEIVKEAVNLEGLFCSQAEQQGFVVDSVDWKTKATCGQEFGLKSSAAMTASNKSAGSQKCVSDSCGNTNLACIQDFQTGTGKYVCKPVLMYGRITVPGAASLAACGEYSKGAAQFLSGKSFDIKSVQLMAHNDPTDSEPEEELSKNKETGENSSFYAIEQTDIEENVEAKDSDPVFLKITVNDASWPLFTLLKKYPILAVPAILVSPVIAVGGIAYTSVGDDFVVVGVPSDTQGVNKTVPVDFCQQQEAYKPFSVTRQGNGLVYSAAPILTWGELRAGHGVRWDINITQDLFSCANGEMVDLTMTCGITDSLQVGTQKYGERCETTFECQSENQVVNLSCLDGKCLYGVWGDPCYSAITAAGAAGENTCATGFTCTDKHDASALGTFIALHKNEQCLMKAGGGFLQRCDPGGAGETTTAGSFECLEPQTAKDSAADFYGCKVYADEKIDEYVWVNALKPICYCNPGNAQAGNIDCPASMPLCVDLGGNDNFCTAGEVGQPCDDGNDCKQTLQCDGTTKTCKLPWGFYSENPAQANNPKNYKGKPTPNEPPNR